MSQFYTKNQIDQIASVIGTRIKTSTDATTLINKILAVADVNFMTDGEKTKLSGLESSKFLGAYLDVASIPTVDAVSGSYADVDAGVGTDAERYIWDVNDNKFVKAVSQVAGETAASIKTKYESNTDTNAFTDALKLKLDNISEATDTTDFIAALDGALL